MKTNKPLVFSLATICLLSGLCPGIQRAHAEDSPAATVAKLPFTIYAEKGEANNHFIPSGWMGHAKSLKMDEAWTNNPHAGKNCLRFDYLESADWAGIVWQDPANDWGDQPGGYNLTGAKKLTFWARGEKGGEVINFKFGVLGADKKYPDTDSGESGAIKLTKDWQAHAIDLTGKDLTRIKTGFGWTLAGQGAPVTFYVDDIRFE